MLLMLRVPQQPAEFVRPLLVQPKQPLMTRNLPVELPPQLEQLHLHNLLPEQQRPRTGNLLRELLLLLELAQLQRGIRPLERRARQPPTFEQQEHSQKDH